MQIYDVENVLNALIHVAMELDYIILYIKPILANTICTQCYMEMYHLLKQKKKMESSLCHREMCNSLVLYATILFCM